MEAFTNRLNHPEVQAILESLSASDDLHHQQVTTSLKVLSSPREPVAVAKRRNSAPSSDPRRSSTSSNECSLSSSPVSVTIPGNRSDVIHHPSYVGLEVVVLPHMLPRHVQTSAGMLGVIESSTDSVAQVRLLHLAGPSTISLPLGQINPVVPQVGDSATVVKGPMAGSKGVVKNIQGHYVLACDNEQFMLHDLSSLGRNHSGQVGNCASLPASDHELGSSGDGGIEVLSSESSPSVQQAMSVCDSPSPAPSPFLPGPSPQQLGSGFASKDDNSPGSSAASTPTMSTAGDPVSSNSIPMVNGENWTVSYASDNHMTPSPCHMTSSNTDPLSLSNISYPDGHLTSSSHMTMRTPVIVANNCQVSSTGSQVPSIGSHMTCMNNSHIASDYNHTSDMGLDSLGSYFDTGCMPPTSSYPMSVGNTSEFTSMASSFDPPISYSQQYVDPHHMLLSHQDPHRMLLAHSLSHASVYDPNSLTVMHQNNPHYSISGAEQNNFGSMFLPRSSHHASLLHDYHANMPDLSSMARMRMMMRAHNGMHAGLNPRMYTHPHLAGIHPRLAGIHPPTYQAQHHQAYSQVPSPVNPILHHQQPSPWLQQTHSQVQYAHSRAQLNPQTQTTPQPASKAHIPPKERLQTLPGHAGITNIDPVSLSKGKCGFFKSSSTKEQEEVKKLMNVKESCRFTPFSRVCSRQQVRVPVLIEKVLGTLLQQEPPLAWYSRSQSKGVCEEELSEGSVRVSSICPLTKHKMEYPCRGLQCSHLQCFDAKAFLELALKRRWMCQKNSSASNSISWKCPICSKVLAPRQLCIDKRLKKAIESSGARELEHSEPGEWIPVLKCASAEAVDVIDLTDDS